MAKWKPTAGKPPAERILAAVLRPVGPIFEKPGKAWDVGNGKPGVPVGEIAKAIEDGDPSQRLAGLRGLAELGCEAVRHPDLLPLVVARLMDPDPDVRRHASELRDRCMAERNRVYEWLYEPAQNRRLRSVASKRVGRANAWDAWQEYAYRARQTDLGPRFYFYSLHTVIQTYDPGAPGAKPFFKYLLSCFDRFCRSYHQHLGAETLAESEGEVPPAFAELVAIDKELERLVRHAMLQPNELACFVRRYVYGLADNEEGAGGETPGVAARDRKVYVMRAVQKLSAARQFFVLVQSLPVGCRGAVIEADLYTGAPRPAARGGPELAWGEELLLGRGYVEEIRALTKGASVGLTAEESAVALLYHGAEQLSPDATAARLGFSSDYVATAFRNAHTRVHDARLARFLATDGGPPRRGFFQETFIGNLGALDVNRRGVAMQICVCHRMWSDAATALGMTVPKLKRAFFEAQGVTPEQVDAGGRE